MTGVRHICGVLSRSKNIGIRVLQIAGPRSMKGSRLPCLSCIDRRRVEGMIDSLPVVIPYVEAMFSNIKQGDKARAVSCSVETTSESSKARDQHDFLPGVTGSVGFIA